MDDERWMGEALKEARKAFMREEVPVGTVAVVGGQLVARAYNQVELLRDATAHAEMLVLGMTSEYLANWRLLDATIYCTLEPCVMCAGALLNARVKRLVWGAPDLRQGANGSWVNLFAQRHPMHRLEVTSGVLAAEAAALMQEFFMRCRQREGSH